MYTERVESKVNGKSIGSKVRSQVWTPPSKTNFTLTVNSAKRIGKVSRMTENPLVGQTALDINILFITLLLLVKLGLSICE